MKFEEDSEDIEFPPCELDINIDRDKDNKLEQKKNKYKLIFIIIVSLLILILIIVLIIVLKKKKTPPIPGNPPNPENPENGGYIILEYLFEPNEKKTIFNLEKDSYSKEEIPKNRILEEIDEDKNNNVKDIMINFLYK